MRPIIEYLNRIRWDAAYAEAAFAIGYWDRVEAKVLEVKFTSIRMIPGDRFAFEIVDAQGRICSIPYHRVRVLYRNGEVIWQRALPASPGV